MTKASEIYIQVMNPDPWEACRRVSSRFVFGLLLGLTLIASGSLRAQTSSADAPWRQAAPFELDAGALYEAAQSSAGSARAEGAGVVVLFQDTTYRFDENGRLEQHRHWIYRIQDAASIPDWSNSQVRWAPWRQERPQIRARVISADGSEHWLDPESARDRQAPETPERRPGERLLTEASLPAVSVGAVVEEEIKLVERVPEWIAGTTHRHYTALLAPTLDGRLTLDASTRLALRYGARLMSGLEPSSTEVENGRVRVVFNFSDLPAVEPPQDGAPGHRPRFPQIAFSTGRDWQKVATVFSRQVDEAITTASLAAIGEDLRRGAGLVEAPRIAAILEAVRSRVRFNGLEIGATDLDFDVDRTLERGEGDSLTLAIATVSALRRAGLQAQVALIKTGFGIDVEPRLPGLGLFDHALVHLGAPDAEGQWLEPSARYARPGELTLGMQGRFALIASPETTGLRRTPASEPSENLAVEVREIFFADLGPGRLVERCRYFGSAERTQRRITGSLDDISRRRGYEAYVNAFHLASRLGSLTETSPRDLSGPFELEIEALESSRVRTDVESAVLEVPIRELARRLPPVLLEDPRPRTEEFIFPEPFSSEWRYEVHPPLGFRLTELPRSETKKLGPATFEQKWRVEGDLIIGELKFDVGQRLLAPAQFEALRGSLEEFLEREPSTLRFALELNPQAPGQVQGRDSTLPSLLSQLRQASDREPERASHRVRWALGLLQAGLGVEARLQAKKAATLEPEWGLAHWAFGWTLLHDEAGEPFGIGAQLDDARKAFAAAARLMPDEPRVLSALARLEERGARGERYSEGASFERAAAAYGAAAGELGDARLHRDRLRLLLIAERFDEVDGAVSLAARKIGISGLGDKKNDSGLLGDLLGEAGDPLDRVGLEAFRLAASHMLGGVATASSRIQRRAAVELAVARHYEAAARLVADLDPALAARLQRAQRFEGLTLHPEDPSTPLRSLLTVLRHDWPKPEDIAKWLREGFGPLEIEQLFQSLRKLVPRDLEGVPLPPATRADFALADLEIKTNGAPHLGYRLALSQGDRYYVTLRDEALRLGAFGSERSTLGFEALRRLRDGDLPGAQQWLIWARGEIDEKSDSTGDPLGFSPFDRLWPVEAPEELESTETLRAAVAALAARASGAEALEMLRQVESSRGVDPAILSSLRVAKLDALASAGDFLGLESLAGELLDQYPASNRAFVKQLEALAALEQWQQLEETVNRRRASGQVDVESHRVLAGLAVDRGQPGEAADLLRKVTAEEKVSSGDAANLLLLMLLEDPSPMAEARGLIERTRENGEFDSRWWRSVAAWRLEEGSVREAREALARSVELSGGRLQLADAYIVGRLAELCGMSETARELFLRLESEADAGRRAPLVRLLASRKLR